jgi:2,4-diaminopentanoate dehydrogenase
MIVNRYNKTPAKPRIVLCGIGQYGRITAEAALDCGYEIVGAYNRAGPKIGKDLGRVFGWDRNLGVIVEDIATADLTKVQADVGICTQSNDLRGDMPTYTRLMSAGINVISLAMQAYYPYGCDPEAAAEIDACARKNKVTFTGSGLHDLSRLWCGMVIAGQCTKLTSLYHESLTDYKMQGLPEQMAGFGVGGTVENYWKLGIDKANLWPVYTAGMEHVLTALGYTVTEKSVKIEPIVRDEPFDCPWLNTVIPAGHVLGTRTIGHVKTREGVFGDVKTEGWICQEGEEDYTLWRVEGKPRGEIRMKRLDPDYINGASLVNRIKDVIAAPPGIGLISQYGPMQGPELGRQNER